MALDRLLDALHARITARYDRLAVLVLAMAVLLADSLRHGQDLNWDSRNYHFASAYLFVNGLLSQQAAPSQLQTWFNPLVYLPSYWMIRHWSPVATSIVLAIVPAFNAPLVYAICRRCLAGLSPARTRLCALISVGVGVTGALFLSEVGTTFADDTLSILMLGAILAFMRAADGTDGRAGAWLAAGALLGVSVGLKLTNGIFGVAFCAACLPLLAARSIALRSVVLVVLGAAAGFAISGGWWAARVWVDYGNPVFPLLNNVFRSPLAQAVSTTDPRFVPESAAEFLRYPWRMAVGDHLTPGGRSVGAEIWYRDARYLIGIVAAAGIMLASFLPAGRRRVAPPLLFLAWFFAVGFVLWLGMFGIARYAVVFELLGGVMVFGLFGLLIPRGFLGLAVPVAIVLFTMATTLPGRWERYPFGADWFGIRVPAALAGRGAVFVFTDPQPLSYVIPFLPADARFVRVGGNFPLRPDAGLGARSAAIIAGHTGALRSISLPGEEETSRIALARFRLAVVPGSCVAIPARAGDMVSCALTRI